MIKSKIFINFLTYMLIISLLVGAVSAANESFSLRYNPFTGKLDYYTTGYMDLNISGVLNVGVNGSTNFESTVRFNQDVIFFDNITLIGGSVINSTLIVKDTSGTVIFYINSSQNNNVGIGTSNPVINPNYQTAPGLTIQSPNPGITFIDSDNANKGYSFSSLQPRFIIAGMDDDGTNAGAIMTLERTGNIGIGTTTPLNKLDVVGNATIRGGNMTIGSITDPTNQTMFDEDGVMWRCGPNTLGVISCS